MSYLLGSSIVGGILSKDNCEHQWVLHSPPYQSYFVCKSCQKVKYTHSGGLGKGMVT